MNLDRLRKIIAYSESNRDSIHTRVKNFCSFVSLETDSPVLNILQIARSAFEKKGYFVFEIPVEDYEIGALCYKRTGLGYVVLNTSLPRVNVNFAIAHEIYYVFFGNDEFVSKVEFFDEHYYEREEEFEANIFAGILLLPESGFRRMYAKFKIESGTNEFDTLIRLMSYFQVPYMAVLIRCLELNLFSYNSLPADLFNYDSKVIKQKMSELWLDDTIMNSSGKDDYRHIEELVESRGREFIQAGYITEHVLSKILENMRNLFIRIKGK